MLFPFVTWMVGLVVYYAGGQKHIPAFGVGLHPQGSSLELIGFLIIIGPNVIIVLLKNKASLASLWCAKIDESCCC